MQEKIGSSGSAAMTPKSGRASRNIAWKPGCMRRCCGAAWLWARICVDSSLETAQGQPAFSEDDLRLLLMVAHYAAMALSNQMLQKNCGASRRSRPTCCGSFRRLWPSNFSVAAVCKLSGERSEVTILYSDIRGFTNLSRNMEPIEVVEMLNDYFNRLIPIIFAHGGTVDKYIGDAILAVFGSPKPDAQQHENAVRAAMDMQGAMRTLNERRAAQGKTTCEMGHRRGCGRSAARLHRSTRPHGIHCDR
jgi:adenylate cyclase